MGIQGFSYRAPSFDSLITFFIYPTIFRCQYEFLTFFSFLKWRDPGRGFLANVICGILDVFFLIFLICVSHVERRYWTFRVNTHIHTTPCIDDTGNISGFSDRDDVAYIIGKNTVCVLIARKGGCGATRGYTYTCNRHSATNTKTYDATRQYCARGPRRRRINIVDHVN